MGSLLLLANGASCGEAKPLDDAGTHGNSADSAAANKCGVRNYSSSAGVTVLGPDNVLPYEGPAIVERSVPNDLILAFTPTGAATPAHARLFSLPPKFSSLPVGAKVWIAKSADPPFLSFGPALPAWFTLRDKKDGHFFMASGADAAAALYAPFTFDNKKATCTGPFDDQCASGTATYSSVDVHGDSTVAIEDGHTGTVPAGGVAYDVNIVSKTVANPIVRCGDYFGPDERFGVDIKAKDPASLVATLEMGPPIACALDNAEQKDVTFTFFDGSVNYDDKIVYTKRCPTDGDDCFLFNLTLPDANGAPSVVQILASPGLFPEPPAGQELWLTNSDAATALRGPNHGPLLLVQVKAAVPFDAATKTEVASVVGFAVDTRDRCRYSDNSSQTRLWDVTLATTTPVVVRPYGHSTATIGGRDFDAWMWEDSGRVGLTLAAH